MYYEELEEQRCLAGFTLFYDKHVNVVQPGRQYTFNAAKLLNIMVS